MMVRQFVMAVLLILLAAPVASAEMPKMIKAGGQDLQLNGQGMRTKFFFKVYQGGLYLQQTGQSDAVKIIKSDEPMAIRMQWMRDVPADKLIEGWNSGFSHSTNGKVEVFSEKIQRFNSVFKDGAKENEVHKIIYTPGEGTAVYDNGNLVEKIEGKAFKEAVFGIWLGEETEVPDLKNQMLGK